MKSEFDGHTKPGTFSMVDRAPKGRKPVSFRSGVLIIKRTIREK